MDEIFETPQEKIKQAAKVLEPCWLILDTHAVREAGWNGGNGMRREKCQRIKCSVCGAVREEQTGYFCHGQEMLCRKCGRRGEIINPRLYAKADIAKQQRNAVIITAESPESVWTECITFRYYLNKSGNSAFTSVDVCKLAMFNFSPGKAEKWIKNYTMGIYCKVDRAIGFEFYEGSYISGLRAVGCSCFGVENLGGTFLKYLPLEKIRNSCRDLTETFVRYCKWPAWTELCLKTGNIAALTDTMSSREINRRGKSIDELFGGLTKEKKKLLFQHLKEANNLKSNEIAAAYSALKLCNAEAFRRAKELFKGVLECRMVFEIMSVTGLSPIRLKNYLEKQVRGVSLYRDYINECKQLGYPLDDERVLFPKDLAEKHAQTNALCRYSISEGAQKMCMERHERLVKMGLELTSGELLVRVPTDGKDIIAEGAKLSHCVGGYATKHARGDTTILFIRKTAEPDTPYFTLEIDIKTGHVIQCYGYKNKNSYKNTPSVAQICGKLTRRINKANKNNERQEKTA